MERILTTHEATVQTVQVEIKVLKVGKKQVTMGMFRQLPHDILLDPETVQLRGVPWGHVRYWWEGDGSGLGHGPKLHVVWQLGEELRRGVVFKEPDPVCMRWYRTGIQDSINDWVIARFPQVRQFEVKRCSNVERLREVSLDGKDVQITLDHMAFNVLESYWYWRDRDPQERAEEGLRWDLPRDPPDVYAEKLAKAYANERDRRTQALDAYQALRDARLGPEVTATEVEQRIRAQQYERDAYKAQWADQWQVLSALPQLFIAV